MGRSSAMASVALLSTPGGSSGSSTNPFDVEPEQLTQPSCSPSMFLSRSRRTPGSRRSFRWSIEQLAGLFPANIDEREPSIPQPTRSDALYEEQSQQAIEMFFSRHEIVPSPWEPTGKVKGHLLNSNGLHDGNHTLYEEEPEKVSVWSQTTLSIPPDADLGSLLGEYFTFDAAQDKQVAVPSRGNTSRDSLRRKLFCNAMEGRMQTPERRESQRLSVLVEGQNLSPVHMALCSSPIGGHTRCSQGSSPDGECMQLSPICRQARTRPLPPVTPQQQRSMQLSEIRESSLSTDEDDPSDSANESLATGAGDVSVLTAGDRSDCMQLSPCANGLRQHEPL
ncbi:protein aurora borealis-like isoform X1 [Amblyomma americanum]